MTVAELYFWAELRRWGPGRREYMHGYLNSFVVYGSTRRLCLEWALVMAEGRRLGRPMDETDAWIAATARLYDLPLMTNNLKHFQGVSGVRMVSGPTR